MIPASQEAYSARAIANLVGSDELVQAINVIAEVSEDIYHSLNVSEPKLETLDDLGTKLKDSKLAVYSHIRAAYEQ